MNARERGAMFARYVGLELKGAIISRDTTAKAVAAQIDRADANLNRWLNGKTEIPMSVVCEVAEALRMEPRTIVEHAYDRMIEDLGELDAAQGLAPVAHLASGVRGPRDTSYLETVELDPLEIAASTDNTPIDPGRGEA